MKALLFSTLAVALMPMAAAAQSIPLDQWGIDVPFCWIQRENGAILNLSDMCGSSGSLVVPVAAERSVASRPLAGNTCSDFTNQLEAQYHFQQGTAPSSLDREGDGVACEFLSDSMRMDGNRIQVNRYTTGNRVELYRIPRNNEHYLRVEANGVGTFTTRSFSDGETALRYGQCYFANDIQACDNSV